MEELMSCTGMGRYELGLSTHCAIPRSARKFLTNKDEPLAIFTNARRNDRLQFRGLAHAF
jgi:hypothetical protein